jgi:hypothetical protein
MFARQARSAPRFQTGNLSIRYEFAAREDSVKEKDPTISSDLRDVRRMSHDELICLWRLSEAQASKSSKLIQSQVSRGRGKYEVEKWAIQRKIYSDKLRI